MYIEIKVKSETNSNLGYKTANHAAVVKYLSLDKNSLNLRFMWVVHQAKCGGIFEIKKIPQKANTSLKLQVTNFVSE